MLAATEILPATDPASDGRPSCAANSSESNSLPFLDREQLFGRIVIVGMSFNIEKDEPALAVAHHQFISFAGLPFLKNELAKEWA